MTNAELQAIVEAYLQLFPDEVGRLELLEAQLKDHEALDDRTNFRGHITGSAIVLSPDRKKVLLIHHRRFERWQQPGGHWEHDEDSDPLTAASREAVEETAVVVAKQLPALMKQPLVPLDIDTHFIPEKPKYKPEPEHYHHDFRYVFVASSEKLQHQEAEVDGAAWFGLDAREADIIRRPIEKLRAQGFTK